MAESSDVEELDSSKLGTLTYWNTTYLEELQNFEDHGDVGDVWFGEDSAMRVINWMQKCVDIDKKDEIIDIGSGNGMMLFELAREGYSNLTGVDYSNSAVELAKKITLDEFPFINYEVWDVNVFDASKKGKFKVAHDKGTYDAISLNPDDPKTKRSSYMNNVAEILTQNGLLIITSCNWTESELMSHVEGRFVLLEVIPTPQFKFGGKVGNVVTTIVLRKK